MDFSSYDIKSLTAFRTSYEDILMIGGAVVFITSKSQYASTDTRIVVKTSSNVPRKHQAKCVRTQHHTGYILFFL